MLSGDSAYEVGAAGTSYVELFDEATQEPIERDLRVDNGGRDYPHELDYDLGEQLTLVVFTAHTSHLNLHVCQTQRHKISDITTRNCANGETELALFYMYGACIRL